MKEQDMRDIIDQALSNMFKANKEYGKSVRIIDALKAVRLTLLDETCNEILKKGEK